MSWKLYRRDHSNFWTGRARGEPLLLNLFSQEGLGFHALGPHVLHSDTKLHVVPARVSELTVEELLTASEAFLRCLNEVEQ